MKKCEGNYIYTQEAQSVLFLFDIKTKNSVSEKEKNRFDSIKMGTLI